MGWEVRHGRRYLYRNRRVNGKRVKEYIAADDQFGFGEVMAADLARLLSLEANQRRLTREKRAEFRQWVDELLRATATADAELRTIVEGVLVTLGFHKHNRGEWRMKREMAVLKNALTSLEKQVAQRQPIIRYHAPANDAQAVELFAKARSGDEDAKARVITLINERNWVNWIGDIGRQATAQLILKTAAGDPVWEAGITEKVNIIRDELLGKNPTILEGLLVRRVINGWLTTHALELELTVRPPTDARERAHLDAALTRAQKRMAEAVRELARVRRLQAPRILAQLNVAAQSMGNGGSQG
jgi:hypothetical protein